MNEANDRTGVNQAIRNVIWDNKGAGVPGAGDNVNLGFSVLLMHSAANKAPRATEMASTQNVPAPHI